MYNERDTRCVRFLVRCYLFHFGDGTLNSDRSEYYSKEFDKYGPLSFNVSMLPGLIRTPVSFTSSETVNLSHLEYKFER